MFINLRSISVCFGCTASLFLGLVYENRRTLKAKRKLEEMNRLANELKVFESEVLEEAKTFIADLVDPLIQKLQHLPLTIDLPDFRILRFASCITSLVVVPIVCCIVYSLMLVLDCHMQNTEQLSDNDAVKYIFYARKLILNKVMCIYHVVLARADRKIGYVSSIKNLGVEDVTKLTEIVINSLDVEVIKSTYFDVFESSPNDESFPENFDKLIPLLNSIIRKPIFFNTVSSLINTSGDVFEGWLQYNMDCYENRTQTNKMTFHESTKEMFKRIGDLVFYNEDNIVENILESEHLQTFISDVQKALKTPTYVSV